jgi:hypothetical protein
MVATQQLFSSGVLLGEAAATLLATRLAVFVGYDNFTLEGDSLLLTLAINSLSTFSSWCFCNIVSDIIALLSSFQSLNALKVSLSTNFRAHALGKLAAINHVFGSIPKGSLILSSIRMQSGKDPSL